ncbi:prolipoprotein diacylglyceryl transferase [Paenibacillus septentrionalis]|uniref:Phosphatidylglycerol--prolipoprotein diacylglyceryl transferase n=1 Tax=Paenibacillus septentrionalis TaxID=429342 RepID=A0ABW1V6T1_9BACL
MINPVIFELGPLSIRWYGLILALGAVAGLLLAIQEGKRFGIKSDFFMDLLLIGAPTAIIFARIYYVAFQWDYYKNNLGDIFKVWNGGIAIYGAIIGALICGYFFSRAKGYNFWRIADICAPSLLIGQMIGRWGNFVNQEAYGGPVEESFLRETLHIPNFIVNHMFINGEYVHPTFLYESLWSLVGLVLLFVIRRQRFLREGELLATYIGWYSIGRFFIEALRTDSLAFSGPQWLADLMNGLWSPMTLIFELGYLDPAYGNVRSSQLLALLLVLAVIVFIVVRRTTGYAEARYLDPIVNTKQANAAVEKEAAGNATVKKEKKDQAHVADGHTASATADTSKDKKQQHADDTSTSNKKAADHDNSEGSDSGSPSSSSSSSSDGGSDGGGGGGD